MAIKVKNLREDYEYAEIRYISGMGYFPYALSVKSKASIGGCMDFYKTEQGAKSDFTKKFQSSKWGKEYPKPIWVECE